MHRHALTSLAIVLLLPICAAAQAPPLQALVSIDFDGSREAITPDGMLAPVGGEALEYAEGRAGQAADFGEGDWVEYRDIPAINPKSATIELWVKPAFENRDLDDHCYLQLFDADGKQVVEINFAQTHCGPRVLLTSGGKQTNCHADFASKGNEWNHICVTWDHTDRDLWNLRLYSDGVVRAYMDFQEVAPPAVLRLGAKSEEQATNTKALIDAVAVYNRALSEMQVFALHEAAALGSDRIEAIAQRVAADDAETTRRIEQFRNEKRMAMVVGRTIGGWKDEVFGDSYGLPVPDRIDEKQIENTDLSRYDVLLFPGGGGFDLTEAGAEALRQYLQEGGGFVGICAGCYAAGTYKLIEREFYPFRERGQVEVYLHEHPVTEGYHPRRQIALAHANGPLIQPGEEAEDILVYKVGKPPYVCAVAREYGKGRVVAFSAHPEGSAETRRMVRNAIFWAAGVTGAKAE